MTNGDGNLQVAIGDGTLRVSTRNNLVTYAKRKGVPPENWRIETVGGGLVHLHWILRPGG